MKFPDPKLNSNVFTVSKLELLASRDGFGHGLVEAGRQDERVIALCADLLESTRTEWFAKEFPKRYVELGVAEQNLAALASGFANYGKIPFIMSYAAFSPGRNNEQIRTTISLNNFPVKIVGCHAGLSVGPDGATHQALEDIGLMRMQPNMTVLVPCDSIEAEKATLAAAKHAGPVYIRLGREKSPVFTTKETPFEIGKAQLFFDAHTYTNKLPEVGIIACGGMVHNALMAAKELCEEGIPTSVMNLATIKPLDVQAVRAFAQECGALVTVEEHQTAGGMGSAVAECLAGDTARPMEFVGVHDRFGQSGTAGELYKEYGLTVSDIKIAVKKVRARK
jgi:transketolase